jgi:hypothetical protein
MCLGHIVYSLLLRRVGPCLQGTLKFLEGTSGAPFGTFYEGKMLDTYGPHPTHEPHGLHQQAVRGRREVAWPLTALHFYTALCGSIEWPKQIK